MPRTPSKAEKAMAPQWAGRKLDTRATPPVFDVPVVEPPPPFDPRPDLRVVILVPRRAGVEDRDRIWGFVRAWWARDLPTYPIYEADGAKGAFNRSGALNRAADEAGDWDVAVLIDADVLLASEPVRAAVALAAASGRPVSAYHERALLSAAGTGKVLNGHRGDWRIRGFTRTVWYHSVSSAYVVRRDLWDAVGGFDEAFVGWGWEDVAFRCATETVAGVPLIHIGGTLFHLHHGKSAENDQRSATYLANEERAKRYIAARFDPPAMDALLAESQRNRTRTDPVNAPSATRIPRILHRTVPRKTTAEVEAWWERFGDLHPGWKLCTYRDPLDPDSWPMTSDLWDACTSGAQRAGLIRLEALYTHGGVYVDSDVEPYRSLEPLTALPAFAAYEDAKVVPDAVLGCEPRHPAFAEMIHLAREAVRKGRGAWESGPGVTTKVLPGRDDVLLLPPGSLFPYNYRDKEALRDVDHKSEQPWAFLAHHWHFSWQPKDEP